MEDLKIVSIALAIANIVFAIVLAVVIYQSEQSVKAQLTWQKHLTEKTK